MHSRTDVRAIPVARGSTLAAEMSAMPASLRASFASRLVSFAKREEPAACTRECAPLLVRVLLDTRELLRACKENCPPNQA